MTTYEQSWVLLGQLSVWVILLRLLLSLGLTFELVCDGALVL